MATGAAGDVVLRGVVGGCISGDDLSIQRRPYHRNCSCALHKSSGHCSHTASKSKVSYPIRRSWSEGCLAMMAPASTNPSPCSSPAGSRDHHHGLQSVKSVQLISCIEDGDEVDDDDDRVIE